MKQFFTLLLLMVFPYLLAGQTLEWAKLFDIHSHSGMAGFTPNSLTDSQGNVITPVVEEDILKFYKLDTNGNLLQSLNTETFCGEFSKMIAVGNDTFMLFFNTTPTASGKVYKMLKFNSNLQITGEFILNLPLASSSSRINSMFEYDNQVYISLSDSSNQYLFKVNTDNSLTKIDVWNPSHYFNPPIESVLFLNGGKALFSYGYGSDHYLRCISLPDSQMLWEGSYGQSGAILLSYQTEIGNNEIIYYAGAERMWVDGEPDDKIMLKAINSLDGSVMQSAVLIPPGNCMSGSLSGINDLKYNPVTNRLYLSYIHCFPSYGISLLELDTNFSVVNQTSFELTYDELIIGAESQLYIRENGNMTILYKNRKDDIEKGNLYISTLNADLSIGDVLEINITPKNGSESVIDVLPYNHSGIIITGIIPNSNTSIFWEEVQFFTLMVDVDGTLSSIDPQTPGNIVSIYPNPVTHNLYIDSREDIQGIIIYDMTGRQIAAPSDISGKTIDVHGFSNGIYTIHITTKTNTTITHKFIKR